MSKLDESVVEWIIREKRKGRRNKQIAETAGVSIRWVQKLWAKYKDSSNTTYPLPMGRPVNGLPGRREHSAVLAVNNGQRRGARNMEARIAKETGMHSNQKKDSNKSAQIYDLPTHPSKPQVEHGRQPDTTCARRLRAGGNAQNEVAHCKLGLKRGQNHDSPDVMAYAHGVFRGSARAVSTSRTA